MARLQQLVRDDFTGGLNLRANQFSLSENESPEMLNIIVDPRRGFYSRAGWKRWQGGPDFGDASWAPRSAEAHVHPDDDKTIFVTNDGTIWYHHTGDAGTFTDGAVAVNASPHLADFASWGEYSYIACGRTSIPHRYSHDGLTGVFTPLDPPNGADPGPNTNGTDWSNDYTNPISGHAPKAEFAEPHAGYMFYANLREDLGSGEQDYRSRIRWSHPGGQPEAFAFNDYIDIDAGGGQITGLLSFRDHLLIFKRDSLWALYGYDNDSWQLVKVSRHVGAPASTAICRSETAAYFFSASGRNAIYGYTDGEPVEISDPIRPAVEDVTIPNNVWLGWAAQLLVVNLPVVDRAPSATDTTTFIFDLTIGTGAWSQHRMEQGSLGPVVERADTIADNPLSVLFNSVDNHQTVMELGALEQAADQLDTSLTDEPFRAVYSTGWIVAGYPDRLKSWRRMRHICGRTGVDSQLTVEAFYDYEEVARRAHLLVITSEGLPYWRDLGAAAPQGDGFDWDDGTQWAAEQEGSVLVRTVASAPAGGGFGKSRAIKLRYVSTNGLRFSINALICKYIDRMLTT